MLWGLLTPGIPAFQEKKIPDFSLMKSQNSMIIMGIWYPIFQNLAVFNTQIVLCTITTYREKKKSLITCFCGQAWCKQANQNYLIEAFLSNSLTFLWLENSKIIFPDMLGTLNTLTSLFPPTITDGGGCKYISISSLFIWLNWDSW